MEFILNERFNAPEHMQIYRGERLLTRRFQRIFGTRTHGETCVIVVVHDTFNYYIIHRQISITGMHALVELSIGNATTNNLLQRDMERWESSVRHRSQLEYKNDLPDEDEQKKKKETNLRTSPDQMCVFLSQQRMR